MLESPPFLFGSRRVNASVEISSCEYATTHASIHNKFLLSLLESIPKKTEFKIVSIGVLETLLLLSDVVAL